MLLPRTRNRQIPWLQRHGSPIHGKWQAARSEKRQFNPLVAMPVESPGLFAVRIPKPDRAHLAQIICRQPPARIRAAPQSDDAHFTLASGGFERLAGVRMKEFGGGTKRGSAALSGIVQYLPVDDFERR